MHELGIPDMRIVQNNISFNADAGVTRGIHAEPWDKFVSVAAGRVFGAWVDLRAGSKTFGNCFTCTLDPGKAIYVPRGVGNSFQALEDGTAYTYLVNAHWSAELKKTYTFVNLADPALGIEWPIPLDKAIVSKADLHHPYLSEVVPMPARRTLVTGANGQVGHAVRALADRRSIADAFDFTDRDEFDFSDATAYARIDWDLYGTVINCGAYTAVDEAETSAGRPDCWRTNATGAALLARTCAEHDLTLVHISTDYVFDGTAKLHTEDEPLSPLGVYGQSKAAGDLAVGGCPKHYIVRSGWIVGDGHNFVKTMCELSDKVAAGDMPQLSVVDDQLGRLTFADQAAEAIFWLLGYREGDVEPSAPCAFGIYNMTGDGEVKSWADIARVCFDAKNGNGDKVVAVSTADYCACAKSPVAPRPHHSALDLAKLKASGFFPRNWEDDLNRYLSNI
jgi:dTDP-4-dehydrorhamnose 3,5-epimerase/reductase